MLAEGELRANLDDSDKVRDLQDRLADMKAEVGKALRTVKEVTYLDPVCCLFSVSVTDTDSVFKLGFQPQQQY